MTAGLGTVQEKTVRRSISKVNLPDSLMQTASTIDPYKVHTIILEDLGYPSNSIGL
jgi:hypothetical protein